MGGGGGGGGGTQLAETVVQKGSASSEPATAQTTFSAMSKGRSAIAETATDGRFIVVENKTAAALDIGGWKIERCVDMGDVIVFTFPQGTVLGGLATLKIWAKGANGALSGAGNLIWDGGATWGIGFNATDELKDVAGQVEAGLTQKTRLS